MTRQSSLLNISEFIISVSWTGIALLSIINNSLNIIINFIWVASLNLESVWQIDVLSWSTSHSPKMRFHFLHSIPILTGVKTSERVWQHACKTRTHFLWNASWYKREWLHCYLNRHKNHLFMRYLPDGAAICFNLRHQDSQFTKPLKYRQNAISYQNRVNTSILHEHYKYNLL